MALAQFVATVGFLLPTAVWLSLRMGRSNGGEGQFAIELVLGVAIDLLSVLLLARVVTLETATLISRAGWLAAGTIAGVRWWRSGRKARRPGRAEFERFGALALVILGAVALSVSLSRPCAIWDREWHIPLVSSLRGQRVPFLNVYRPAERLFYHFAGDAQAAMLQTLSGGRLHASLALSLLHDIMFALIALNLVCFLRACGIRRTPLAAMVFVAVVMLGPVTLLRDDTRKLETGFALVNYLTLSFRPHVALAYLFALTFIETVFADLVITRVDTSRTTWRGRAAALAALSAALALTDESSLGLLGIALGALWLAFPAVLAPTRRKGLLTLGALVGAILLSMTVFGGSLGPSAPHYRLTVVAPRAPGYASSSVPLSTAGGWVLLCQDLLPVLGALGTLLAIALRARERPKRPLVALALFYATLATISIVALTCLDFEGEASENHRFATAMFVAAPLLTALALERRARTEPASVALGGIAALALYVAVGLGIASTVEWLGSGVAYRQCAQPTFFAWSAERFFDIDCRREAGATLGEPTVDTYVDPAGFYLWSGCHPVFAAAPPGGRHKIKVNVPWFDRPAVEQLHHELERSGGHLQVACLSAPAAAPNSDPICRRQMFSGACRPAGTDFRQCDLDAAHLDALRSVLR